MKTFRMYGWYFLLNSGKDYPHPEWVQRLHQWLNKQIDKKPRIP